MLFVKVQTSKVLQDLLQLCWASDWKAQLPLLLWQSYVLGWSANSVLDRLDGKNKQVRLAATDRTLPVHI